ncbi:MAG: hypothetical protein QM499_06395 [Flavobacteriaceae bacterium]
MEKSIETIWKEGFLKNNALIAPKINNIYNKKSIDIVEKFKRMYRINIIAIFLFAFILLPITMVTDMVYMGIPMFFLFMTIAYYAIQFKNKLEKINKNTNSYDYLKTFDNWTKEMQTFNMKFSRFLYPYVFLSMFAGFWLGGFGKPVQGDQFVAYLLGEFPNMIVVFGFPLVMLLAMLFIVVLLAIIGPKIGEWDLKIGYGRILKRLDSLLLDMEELRTSY